MSKVNIYILHALLRFSMQGRRNFVWHIHLIFLHSDSTVLKKAVEPVQDYVSVVEWKGPEEF